MSHATAMARITTMLNLSGTDLSLITGATKTAPNRPINSTSYQSEQRSDQGRSTGFGQSSTPPVTPPGGPPEGQSNEQSPQEPQRQSAGPLGGQSPQELTGRPPQVTAPQQAVQTPYRTDRVMKGQPPIIFNGERSKGNQFVAEFQNWQRINKRAMDNPFQRTALYLSYIRGPEVDDWVKRRHNQLQRTVLGDPTNGIPPAHRPTGERLWRNLRADFREAYQDTAAEGRAVGLRLRKLRNIENRINEHTDHFKVLETEWSQLDKKPQNLLDIERRIDECIKHFKVLRIEWSRLVKTCLFCNKQGHNKGDCRKLKVLQERGGSPLPQKDEIQTTTIKETKEEKEVPPAYDPDSLMAQINEMKLEDRDSFLDRLLVNDTEDF